MDASLSPSPPASDTAGLAPLVEAPAGFPVTTRQLSADVDGVRTDFVVSAFSDRILVIATQRGTLGTMVSARRDAGEDDDCASYSVDVLLGRRDADVIPAAARRLMQAMAEGGCTRPLLLCLNLVKDTPEAAREVIAIVLANKVW